MRFAVISKGLAEKQADAGDPLGSGLKTLGRVFRSDSPESVDGNGSSGEAGVMQRFKPCRGRDDLAGNGLSKDWCEEDCVRLIPAGDLDLGEIVTGDGDDRGSKVQAGIAPANIVRKQRRVRRKMHAVGLAVQRCLKATVDEQARRRGLVCNGSQDLRGKVGQVGRRQIFFTELNQVDTTARPTGSLLYQGGLLLGFVPGKQRSVGNGASKHVDNYS